MIRNLFFAAIVAALGAGLVNSAIQQFRVIPLILAAETYEGEAPAHDHGEATTAIADEHAVDGWAPQDGLERSAYTWLANLLVAAAFAFIMGAVSMFSGIPITAANGLLWGAAGFFAVTLAPAYGLPPNMPGMPVADTLARQVWWFGAVIATGAAILLVARSRAPWVLALAAVLVAAPHVIGAPVPPAEPTSVPAPLAAAFAGNALGTAAIFWVVLGLAFGAVNDWLARTNRRPATMGAHA